MFCTDRTEKKSERKSSVRKGKTPDKKCIQETNLFWSYDYALNQIDNEEEWAPSKRIADSQLRVKQLRSQHIFVRQVFHYDASDIFETMTKSVRGKTQTKKYFPLSTTKLIEDIKKNFTKIAATEEQSRKVFTNFDPRSTFAKTRAIKAYDIFEVRERKDPAASKQLQGKKV